MQSNETILRKRRYRRTNGRTDRQTWINRTLWQSCGSKKPSYIDDQRILQSDWARCNTGQTQPKVVVWDHTIPWWLSPSEKFPVSIDSLLKYQWSKNTAIWLTAFLTITEEPDFSQTCGFCRIIKNTVLCIILGLKNTHQGIKFCQKPKNQSFLGIFGLFPPNENSWTKNKSL